MSTENLSIDMNAHITKPLCSVYVENGVAKAGVMFVNLTNKIITAVKLKARAYNTFSDPIQVNGELEFDLIIQDLNIEVGSDFADLTVVLPDNAIRKLELVEYQTSYSDGTISTYTEGNVKVFEMKIFDEGDITSSQALATKDVFGNNLKYYPTDTEYGWICCCGRLNNHENQSCSGCGHSKVEVFGITDDDYLNYLIEEYDKKEEAKKEEEKLFKKKKTKAKVRNVFVILSIVLIAFAGLTFFSISQFNSMEGIYYCNESDYYGSTYKMSSENTFQLLISNNKVFACISGEGLAALTKNIYDIVGYNPFLQEAILKSIYNDSVCYIKNTYEDGKFGLEFRYELSNEIVSYTKIMNKIGEPSLSAGDFTTDTFSFDYVMLNNNGFFGRVYNNSDVQFNFIIVEGVLTNDSGDVIDRAWAIANGMYSFGKTPRSDNYQGGMIWGEGLFKTTEGYTTKNLSISVCEAYTYSQFEFIDDEYKDLVNYKTYQN